MRKNLNRLATLALSGMMVMSMAMPAFAAESIPFTKIVHTDGNTYAPNTTFSFTVTPRADAEVIIGQEKFKNNKVDDADKADAVTVDPVTFAPEANKLGEVDRDAQGNVVGAHFKKDTKINIKKSAFKNLGYYFFDLSEKSEPAYQGVRYSAAKYTVVVVKTNPTATDDGFKIIVQRNDKIENKLEKVDSIQNNYGKHFPPETPDFPDPKKPTPEKPNPDPDPNNDTTHDVVIKKRVAGAMGDASKKFAFKVTVKTQTGATGEFYKVTEVNGEGAQDVESNESFFVDGTPKTFEFSSKNGIRIYGLTKGDTVHVEETNGEGYEMTVGAVTEKASYFDKADLTAGKKYEADFMVKKDEAKAEIVNTKNPVTPTGIVMNVAPYAMMLAVAGGLGVVFMNRKKEEE